jgi:hypothetical protein
MNRFEGFDFPGHRVMPNAERKAVPRLLVGSTVFPHWAGIFRYFLDTMHRCKAGAFFYFSDGATAEIPQLIQLRRQVFRSNSFSLGMPSRKYDEILGGNIKGRPHGPPHLKS